jgi:hypothetical protein
MAKKNDLYDSWSVDTFEEFEMAMIPVSEAKARVTPPSTIANAPTPTNGKPKAGPSKPRKKKPAPRRKA